MQNLSLRDELTTVMGHLLTNYRRLYEEDFSRFAVGKLRVYVSKTVIRELDRLMDNLLTLPVTMNEDDFMLQFLTIRNQYTRVYNICVGLDHLNICRLVEIYEKPG